MTPYLRPRVRALLALGFASGLPYLLSGDTLSARLTGAGIDVESVGLLSLAALPYSGKLLWAPLLDRFRLPFLGRRRGWMLLFQLALAPAIVALGLLDPRRDLLAVAACALGVSALSASLDIATDAYRADLLAPDERAPGVALSVLGYRLALVLAGGVALVVAPRIGWRVLFAAMGAMIALAGLATARAPEPDSAPPPPSLAASFTGPLLDYFRREGALAILLFIALYRAGDVVANVMVTPYLLGIGVPQEIVGVVYKLAGTAATVAGALGGGAIVGRIGLPRALFLFGALQTLGTASYAALAAAPSSRTILVAAVTADKLCGGLSIAALEALLCALCDRRYSATQFALLVGASSVAGRLLGGASGFLAARIGWAPFFLATAGLSLPSLALLAALRPRLAAAAGSAPQVVRSSSDAAP